MTIQKTEVNELTIIEIKQEDALAVFTNSAEKLEPILMAIEKEARALIADVTTKKGRDAIRSNAAKIAKTKTAIEQAGKKLADQQKEIPKLIDASRKRSREFLDALQEDVRFPLTKWEAEQERIAAEKARLQAEQEERVRLAAEYEKAHSDALTENELFDLRKEKAERDRLENERIAAEQTRLKAEQDEKDRIAHEESIREQARLDAENAAKDALKKAEQERLAAEQRAKEAEQRAEQERLIAEQRAEREKLAAVLAEQQRTEKERLAREAEEKLRAENKAHMKTVNNDIMQKLTALGFSNDESKTIITAAAKGELGALIVKY